MKVTITIWSSRLGNSGLCQLKQQNVKEKKGKRNQDVGNPKKLN